MDPKLGVELGLSSARSRQRLFADDIRQGRCVVAAPSSRGSSLSLDRGMMLLDLSATMQVSQFAGAHGAVGERAAEDLNDLHLIEEMVGRQGFVESLLNRSALKLTPLSSGLGCSSRSRGEHFHHGENPVAGKDEPRLLKGNVLFLKKRRIVLKNVSLVTPFGTVNAGFSPPSAARMRFQKCDHCWSSTQFWHWAPVLACRPTRARKPHAESRLKPMGC